MSSGESAHSCPSSVVEICFWVESFDSFEVLQDLMWIIRIRTSWPFSVKSHVFGWNNGKFGFYGVHRGHKLMGWFLLY